MTRQRRPHRPTPSPAIAGEGEIDRAQLLIQMHGEPGSGKSTVAKAIGQALPAIVVDKDAIKSPLLHNGMDDDAAGGASYDVMRELAGDFLRAGYSVVMDSPCLWPAIEQKGRELAAQLNVPWKMVEVTSPRDAVEERLATREARLSNPTERGDWDDRPGTYRPSCERTVLDGTRPVEELVKDALKYLRTERRQPPTPSPTAAGAGDQAINRKAPLLDAGRGGEASPE